MFYPRRPSLYEMSTSMFPEGIRVHGSDKTIFPPRGTYLASLDLASLGLASHQIVCLAYYYLDHVLPEEHKNITFVLLLPDLTGRPPP